MKSAILMLVLNFAATSAAADDSLDAVENDQQRLNRAEHRLMLGLLGDGAVSLAAGAGMLVPDGDDQAWRVAGGVTLAFGAINLALGISGTLGTARELREYRGAHDLRAADAAKARRELVQSAHKKALVFGINLGLDVGYVMGGAAAVMASQLGIEHSQRWLAGGVTAMGQGLALAVIDLVGVLVAQRVRF